MNGINRVNGTSPLSASPQQVGRQSAAVPFNVFMDEALQESQQKEFAEQQALLSNMAKPVNPNLVTDRSALIAQVINQDELDRIEQQRRQDRAQEEGETLTSENVNRTTLGSNRLQVTPFQLFMDKALDALEDISKLEFRVNNMIDQFIEGKVSIDEVSIEMSKLNLMISFATTVVSTASQTFKELTQLSI